MIIGTLKSVVLTLMIFTFISFSKIRNVVENNPEDYEVIDLEQLKRENTTEAKNELIEIEKAIEQKAKDPYKAPMIFREGCYH